MLASFALTTLSFQGTSLDSSLHGVGHILIHITLENGIKWSQEAHETISVNRGNLDLGLCDNVGGTRFALEESSLTEVI